MEISKEIGERILKTAYAGKAIEILKKAFPGKSKITLGDIDNMGGNVSKHIFKLIDAENKEREGVYIYADRALRESYQAEKKRQSLH